MHSPDAGLINRNKQNNTLSYFNASLNLPLPCRPIRGIVLISPFYEEWNMSLTNAPNVLSKHQAFVLALSFVDTAAHHKWKYAITPIIRMKDFSEDELTDLYKTIGLGAMKFYLRRVDPKKRMIFNSEESIDFHGFTGPFVQYTYVRLKSILPNDHLVETKPFSRSLLKVENA